jgi:hypothetical protein
MAMLTRYQPWHIPFINYHIYESHSTVAILARLPVGAGVRTRSAHKRWRATARRFLTSIVAMRPASARTPRPNTPGTGDAAQPGTPVLAGWRIRSGLRFTRSGGRDDGAHPYRTGLVPVPGVQRGSVRTADGCRRPLSLPQSVAGDRIRRVSPHRSTTPDDALRRVIPMEHTPG